MIEDHLARSGLVSLDAFETAEYAALFAELETAQTEFLSHESSFRSPEYPWVRDALHEWSRCWEYVYALAHLRRARPAHGPATLVDFGSGVTFFPFVVARDGWDVVCLDNDPVVIRDLTAAAGVTRAEPGSVRPSLNGSELPLGDRTADAAYSISVLEHIAEPRGLVAEIARVLRPGGVFVLTFDVDLNGKTAGISPAGYAALLNECARSFDLSATETTVHPRRVLDNFSGPCARSRQRQVPGVMLRTRTGDLRPLLGGPIADEPVYLACYAAAFIRRE